MIRSWLKGWRKFLVGSCAAVLVSAGTSRAQDKDADLRAQLAEQARQIQELKAMIQARQTQPVALDAKDGAKPLTEDAVRGIVAGYLQANPGAGAETGVHAGYKWGQGFFIKDSVAPSGPAEWADDCKIPFELRFKG